VKGDVLTAIETPRIGGKKYFWWPVSDRSEA
jgi:hypothetical protein